MKKIMVYILLGLFFESNLIECKMNEVMIQFEGDVIWSGAIGDPNNEAIIFVHGGPGAPSFYLNPLKKLSEKYYLVFFDQIGGGRSSTRIDPKKLNIDYFVNQIEAVRTHYKLDKFNIYGQSFGAAFSIEYYKKFPNRISSMILSSPYIDTDLWVADCSYLISQMPLKHRNAIRQADSTKDYTNQEYIEAVNHFYQHHVARKLPWSDDINNTFEYLGVEVYNFMWGSNEFTPSGKFLKYSCIDFLPKIQVPVLINIGKYDEVLLQTAIKYQKLIKNSQLVINEQAAHLTMQDNPNFDIIHIEKFLMNK